MDSLLTNKKKWENIMTIEHPSKYQLPEDLNQKHDLFKLLVFFKIF